MLRLHKKIILYAPEMNIILTRKSLGICHKNSLSVLEMYTHVVRNRHTS